MTRLLGAPATARKTPRLELVERPGTFAVPEGRRTPLTKGVPAVGRTRMFCQVNFVGLMEVAVTVKVIWLVVTDVTLPWTGLLPEPVIFSLKTVGVVPPVSNLKPAGAFRMMVPVPISPGTSSL